MSLVCVCVRALSGLLSLITSFDFNGFDNVLPRLHLNIACDSLGWHAERFLALGRDPLLRRTFHSFLQAYLTGTLGTNGCDLINSSSVIPLSKSPHPHCLLQDRCSSYPAPLAPSTGRSRRSSTVWHHAVVLPTSGHNSNHLPPHTMSSSSVMLKLRVGGCLPSRSSSCM